MGFNLFPLRPSSKRPIAGVSWKDYQTKKYTAEIPETCNAAVVLGDISDRIFVIDVDDISLYEELEDDTFTVRTGQGYHIYYKYKAFAPPTRRLDDERGRHIDVQSNGAYVVAPGSFYQPTPEDISKGKYTDEQNKNGFYYTIINDSAIKTVNVQDIKEKLDSMGFNTQTNSVKEIAEGVSEGGRNDSMFKYACYLMREKQLYDEPLLAEMQKVNEKNSPPLSQFELEHILESVNKYEGNKAKKTHKVIKEEGQEIQEIPMQKITPEHEGIPIKFNALITAVDERHTYTKSVTAVCNNCNKSEDLHCDEFHAIHLPFCAKHKTLYEIDRSTMVTEYIQLLRIEEFLEDARNSTPVEFDAEIIGDKIGEAFMSDRKEFVARFRSIPTKEYNKIIFDVESMDDIDQKEGCMPTPEELVAWRNHDNIFEHVRNSIAPEMYMNSSIKETLMLSISGGTSLNGKRDEIHIALLGDGQLGKSELLRFAHKMIPGSGMVIGTSTSGPGLTIGMVKMANGQMKPKAGMLPAHTGFPVGIDEADKLKKDDQNALLECMEQQTVSQSKAGTGAGLRHPAVCSIQLAGNPVNGKYNPKIGFMDNFVFDAPFISRFDIVWVMIDQNSIDIDRETRKHIREYKSNKDEYLTMEELQRYFTFVRKLSPEVPESLEPLIDELHESIRPRNKIDGLPVGWRQYYGIYRLVTACAALHLREVVIEEDFDLVKKIINESFESIPLNDQGYTKKRDSKENVFLEAWSVIVDKDGLGDKEDFIMELMKSEYFGMNAGTVFDARERGGVFELDNTTGKYRKVK